MRPSHDALFTFTGTPKFGEAFPLALQHVVAMIVGCVTPAIIVASAASLSAGDSIRLVQAALVISALATLIQLFPIGKRWRIGIGCGLPVIVGVAFCYVPTMQAIAESQGISAILGAQIVGGVVAIVVALFAKPLHKLFPPVVTGTMIFTIGISLYPTAINYMAGGVGNAGYGSWQNWVVAIFTLVVVTALTHYGKGIWKLSSILGGILAGYALAACLHLVDLNSVAQASWLQLPQPFYFGIVFEPSACISMGVLFAITAIQTTGDYTNTTVGAMNRQPTLKELQNGMVAYGVTGLLGSVVGGLPTCIYSQNVGIVTTNKVINRWVFALAALMMALAGILPKFSALLTTIPQCVLGGATVSVFASIAMSGIRLAISGADTGRSAAIAGLAAALGLGITLAPAALAGAPIWLVNLIGKSPFVLSTAVAVLLNLVLPKAAPSEEQTPVQSSTDCV